MQKLIYVNDEDCTFLSKEFSKHIPMNHEEGLIIEPDTALNYFLHKGWKIVQIVPAADHGTSGAFVLIEN